jgi:thiol-disulfide isomerase/thioredoxin
MIRRVLPWLFVFVAVAAACGDSDVVTEPGDTSTASTVIDTAPTTTIPISVSGRALPPYLEVGSDGAIGAVAPSAKGSDLLTGETIAITVVDQPLVVAFFAHWCPHCQREVDELTAWFVDNELPDGVDFAAVSTFEDATRNNHPPADWLGSKDWPYPVIADSDGFAAAEAFGATSIPFWIFINSDGTVVERVSGNLGPDELAARFAALS